MNAAFGIDHPLIAVRDIEAVRGRLSALGFRMTDIGKHPWGTSTSLAMFRGCLIEIMGIYDDRLLDQKPAGGFRFGRHVHSHLMAREGIALTALHSTHISRDVARAKAAGMSVSGRLEFGRDVTLPDGNQDRTKTTLALLPDTKFPRLSMFLCQQHRPDLIYVQKWMDHPNGVHTIAGVTILADIAQHGALRNSFAALYGEVQNIDLGFRVKTANGTITVQAGAAIEQDFAALPLVVQTDPCPAIVAMDFHCHDLDVLQKWVTKSGLAFKVTANQILLTDAQKIGNTFFRFSQPA